MRTLPKRPALSPGIQKQLQRQSKVIASSSNPKETAERKYANARKAKWFSEVIEKLKTMAIPGQSCMFCDANEGTDVEHYRPKSVFPTHAFAWENLLWGCSVCNRNKGSRFPPDTEAGDVILNPVEDKVWKHFFIDEFGILTPVWRSDLDAFDPRALSTLRVLKLDRQTLQERRLLRLRSLKKSMEDILTRFRSHQMTLNDVNARLEQWKSEPFQADVADYFLAGPGKKEDPFASLLALVES